MFSSLFQHIHHVKEPLSTYLLTLFRVQQSYDPSDQVGISLDYNRSQGTLCIDYDQIAETTYVLGHIFDNISMNMQIQMHSAMQGIRNKVALLNHITKCEKSLGMPEEL